MAESTALVKARQEVQARKAQMVGLNQDAATGAALPAPTVQALVAWAERYELDAYAGHVVLYRGKPFVTAEGAVAYGARKLGARYQGFSCEPLKWEDLKALGYDGTKGDCGWRCNVFVKDFVVPITDYGIVTNDDIEAAIKTAGARAQYLPLVKTPMLLAKARAIRRAFKLACPLDARAAEVLAEPGEMVVNGETGEIIDPPKPEPKPGMDPSADEYGFRDVDQAAEPDPVARHQAERAKDVLIAQIVGTETEPGLLFEAGRTDEQLKAWLKDQDAGSLRDLTEKNLKQLILNLQKASKDKKAKELL